MTVQLTGIRVFLASPNGLQSEREYFKRIVWEFNEKKAIPANIVFVPVMFEQIPGGAEQAQKRINRRIEDCDYCVTMFWNDLGSRPEGDSPEGSVSVTDGEYRKALKLIEDGSMKEVVILCKDIPQFQMDDPGEKLIKFLEYKKELQKTCSYEKFKNNEELTELIEKLFYGWLLNVTDIAKEQRPPVGVMDYDDPSSIAGGS